MAERMIAGPRKRGREREIEREKERERDKKREREGGSLNGKSTLKTTCVDLKK